MSVSFAHYLASADGKTHALNVSTNAIYSLICVGIYWKYRISFSYHLNVIMIQGLFSNKIVYLLYLTTTATAEQAKALKANSEHTHCIWLNSARRERLWEKERHSVRERLTERAAGSVGYPLMPIWSSEAFALLIFMLSAAHLLRHIKKLVSAQSGSESWPCRGCLCLCCCCWRRLGKKSWKKYDQGM